MYKIVLIIILLYLTTSYFKRFFHVNTHYNGSNMDVSTKFLSNFSHSFRKLGEQKFGIRNGISFLVIYNANNGYVRETHNTNNFSWYINLKLYSFCANLVEIGFHGACCCFVPSYLYTIT